ncbi:MAG TPA: hypothetical protein VIH99_06855 [Bdellovibrionota bacterium]
MLRLKKILVLASLLFATSPCRADQAALDLAEKLFQSGEWQKAEKAYKAEMAAGSPDRLPPAFYFNYGTILSKGPSAGEAYVYLLRYAFAHPFDSDGKQNLRLVEQQLPATARTVRPATWLSWWPSGLRLIPWRIWLLTALVFSALAFLLSNLRDKAIWISCASLAGALAIGALLTAWQTRMPVYGSLTMAKLKSGPGATFSDLPSLEPGSLVNRELERDGWLKIRFIKKEADSETVGWVEGSTVLEVL